MSASGGIAELVAKGINSAIPSSHDVSIRISFASSEFRDGGCDGVA